MPVDNSKYLNTLRNQYKNFFVLVLWQFVDVFFFSNPLNTSSRLRVLLLRMFGAKVGVGVVVKPGVKIKFPWNLSVGKYSWIGERVWIDNLMPVTIGDNCCLSQGAMIVCGNHNYKKSTFDLIVKPVVIEDGCWVGARSVVCPGVTCRSHSVLTVGSVATHDLETYSVYQGNPAVRVRDRIIEK